MIEGWFGERDELIFEIDFIAADELDYPTKVTFDTGFSGWLAVDEQDLQGLDWTRIGERDMGMAKGEAKFDIYAGKVKIDGTEFDIPVHVGQDVSEILIGRQWLKSRKLIVDMAVGILTLGN